MDAIRSSVAFVLAMPHIRKKIQTAHRLVKEGGLAKVWAYVFQKWCVHAVGMGYRVCPWLRLRRLRVLGMPHPLYCRRGSSDAAMFYEVFQSHEYDVFCGNLSPRLIVDCGANVGYAAAFFMARFPDCHVIAVEPDPGNYRMLERNMKPYGARATLLNTGVWSHTTGLVINEEVYRDGSECTRQVRECRPSETPTMMATDIGTILDNSGFDRISILKVDVERAEAVIFSSGYERWIPKVDMLIIELHDTECEEIFHRAIAGIPFKVSKSGGLTVCQRMEAAA